MRNILFHFHQSHTIMNMKEKERRKPIFKGKYKATSFEEINRYFQLWSNLTEFLNRKKKVKEFEQK